MTISTSNFDLRPLETLTRQNFELIRAVYVATVQKS
jgi:hypothetical protein